MSTTQSPIVYVNGVGPDRAAVLAEELGVRTMRQMLEHYPFRYVDKSSFSTVAGLTAFSGEVQIKGQITGWETVGTGRQSRLVAYFKDSTGEIELVWFKGAKWISRSLKANVPLIVYGKVNDFKGKKSIPHPEIYAPETQQSSALEPVYSTTDKLTKKGLHSKGLGKVIYGILKTELAHIQDPLSEAFRTKHGLIGLPQALQWIHFPKSVEHLEAAKKRIKFDEFFFLQLTQLRNKMRQKTGIKGYAFDEVGQTFLNFYENHLPFELTSAQKRVVKEIRADVRTGAQMNRLVQGDVGTSAERASIHQSLADGSLSILIGTHALIEPTVKFANLGLAVIDEQHRFGVAQRAKLWKKNEHPPHVLVMTATPIPRTLAMSIYGDLDVSTIDELPPGRKPIKTHHIYDKNRLKLNGFMQREIAKGRQVYVVFPLIEESEKLDLKNLQDGYEQLLRDFPRPQYEIAVVHGRMSTEEKEGEMQRFAKGKANILVATTV
ncbi:MAG: ATP-dependent DNA helicase RecG, partial [Flavobacteriia bacterium]|nr:ATP-dependent DNA helicase RecG [Flavobacteriia bacterium]